MKHHIFLTKTLLVLSLLASLSLKSQSDVYDLQQCIDLAVNNNITLKVSRLNVEMQRNSLQQAKAALLPTLTANATHGYNWGQTIDLYTNQFASERVQSNNFYLQSGVTLFNGFRLLNMASQQQYNLMAKQLESDKSLNDIMLNVATAYMQVLYSIEQLAIADGQLSITRQQVARTAQLVEGGMLAKGELLSIEAQFASEEVNQVRAKNALNLAYLTLAQIMNIPAGTSFTIETPDLNTVAVSETLLLNPVDIFMVALDNQPQIKGSELMVKSADAAVKIARGASIPSLYLSASLGTGFSGARKDYSPILTGYEPNGMVTSGFDTVYAPTFDLNESLIPFGTQISDNFNQSVSLYLTIPIFNGLQNYNGVKNAQLSLANARYSQDLQKQQLMQEIQQAHADATAALKNYQAAKKSLEALRESFGYATERFTVGMINSLEYNDAKNRLMASEAQVLGARYEYVFKTKLLDFYMGKEISL